MDLKPEVGCILARCDQGRGGAWRSAMLVVSLVAGTVLTLSPHCAEAEIKAEFWHAMTGELGSELDRLVADFNRSQSDDRIVAVRKGGYTETVTAAIFAVRTHAQPAIVQVNEVATATMMAARGAIYPVFELMRHEGIGFDRDAFLPAISGYYSDMAGNLLSFPFNASTPILYYNKDLFRDAGLNDKEAPKTWPDVDLFFRPSGEERTSNFLLWQSWYAELVFADVLWPDVDRRTVWEACEEY